MWASSGLPSKTRIVSTSIMAICIISHSFITYHPNTWHHKVWTAVGIILQIHPTDWIRILGVIADYIIDHNKNHSIRKKCIYIYIFHILNKVVVFYINERKNVNRFAERLKSLLPIPISTTLVNFISYYDPYSFFKVTATTCCDQGQIKIFVGPEAYTIFGAPFKKKCKVMHTKLGTKVNIHL